MKILSLKKFPIKSSRWITAPSFSQIILIMILFFSSQNLLAGIVTVTNTGDDGAGSLRNTILNAFPGDEIQFSVTGTITLTSGELLISKDLTFTGPGAQSLTISGNNTSRIFEINSGTVVSISGLTITNGKAPNAATIEAGGSGGAILNNGTLTITSCYIKNSKAGAGGMSYLMEIMPGMPMWFSGGRGGDGGGIANNGSLTINSSTVYNNNSGDRGVGENPSSAGNGGGVYSKGTLILTNCTIANNTALSTMGGGLYADGSSSVTITNCTVSQNTSNFGGGMNISMAGTTYIENTLVAFNNGNAGDEDLDANGMSPTITANNNAIGTYLGSHDFSADPSTITGTTASYNVSSSLDLNNTDKGVPTLALLAGSVCIDAGTNTANNGIAVPANDERGAPRYGTADIGAFEVNPDFALPVQLTDFTANQDAGTVTLIWKTQTEVNNYGFEIQRSFSALDKSKIPALSGEEAGGGWIALGFVEGHGNSNSPKEYSYIDTNPIQGNIQYRLKQIDMDGNFEYYSSIAQVNFNLTSVNDLKIPAEFTLEQNYPNPFNPATVIKFGLPVTSKVTLEIFDVLGKRVTQLTDDILETGYHEVKLEMDGLSSGIYFYRINAKSVQGGKDFIAVKKMLMIK